MKHEMQTDNSTCSQSGIKSYTRKNERNSIALLRLKIP